MAIAEEAAKQPEVETSEEKRIADDFRQFLRGYASKQPPSARDILNDRYRILISNPLPEFTTPLVKAYEAKDEKDPTRSVYAAILPNHIPLREKAIKALVDIRTPHMVPLLAIGKTELSAQGEVRMVAFFERPTGRRLSDWLREVGKPLPDRFITEEIIRPLNEVLTQLAELKIAHGSIHLDRIYYDKKLTLGECITHPCGYLQPFLFEPLERISAQPLGKGEGASSTDSFALGVLAIHLATGKVEMPSLEIEQYLPYVAEHGSYLTLSQSREFSEYLQDFLRGTLNDHPDERWTPQQIAAWLGGKRFNLIPPVPLRESSRSFEFLEKEYPNRRMLGYAMAQQWEEAVPVLRNEKIIRWIEISAHKSEMAEIMERIVRNTGGDTARNPKQNNELVARALLVLDPPGPIRYLAIRAHIDGLGVLLAEALHTQNKRDLQMITDIIDLDLTGTWAELNQDNYSPEIAGLLFKMQRIRTMMKSTSLGGGIERALYDLNPALPCQSPRLLRYHITSTEEMLKKLDAIAQEQPDTDILDRHAAAFLCSRLELSKEVKITELINSPGIASHPKLLHLKLLATAQEKLKQKQLPGLTRWIGLQLLPLARLLHRRHQRGQLLHWTEQAVAGESLSGLLGVWTQEKIFREDEEGFSVASQQYRELQAHIDRLSDDTLIQQRARKTGDTLTLTIAYLVFIGALYFLVSDFIG